MTAEQHNRRWTLPALVIAAVGVRALMHRSRLAQLPVLTESELPVSPAHTFVTAGGVELDQATRRAASAFARREGLEVLDLVPGDLPVVQALELLAEVDPVEIRANRLREGRGAYHALLVDTGVLRRAGFERTEPIDRPGLATLTVRLKRHASGAFAVAVAPDLRAVDEDLEQRPALLEALFDRGAPFLLAAEACAQAIVLRAAAAGSPLGPLALAATCAQPYLVFAEGPVRPRDLGRAGILRPLTAPARLAKTAWLRTRRTHRASEDDERRARYQAEIDSGIDRLLEPRRDRCPWCASADLTVHVRCRDYFQHKPGKFTLERCGECGLIFQNPRLTIAGLDFYYRDFYDGLGERIVDFAFDLGRRHYEERARMVAAVATPGNWLDVGAGHGHFSNQARVVLPSTTFDGLDISEAIEEAARRRWIDRSYRGLFPALADELAGSYDVVSMHHTLEHVRDPRAEIEAAWKVLRPGGHLLIEVPNPESVMGRLLGRWWCAWFQPQHQNLISIGRLAAELEAKGLEVIAQELGPAHQTGDITAAVYFLSSSLAPDPRRPWEQGPKNLSRTLWHRGVILASLLPMIVAAGMDVVLSSVLRHSDQSNTYRVLARKPPTPGLSVADRPRSDR